MTLNIVEYILYTAISLIALITLILFIPHTIFSSLDDTPLIYYRILMLIAAFVQFLNALLINFNGTGDEITLPIKTLSIFLDWMYVLIVIPLAVPFINNTISAARTASQISSHQSPTNIPSLLNHMSTTDAIDIERRISTSLKCLQRLMACITFIVWL